MRASAAEVVARLEHPPGNIAVSDDGRVFITFHPDADPTTKVAEIVNGRPRPYPSRAFQSEREGAPWFDSPLSLRVDRLGRLWVLDLANHGLGQPRLIAIDLATNAVVHDFSFPSDIAGVGSHLNDFAVSPNGRQIYIADASIFGKSPALVVYDVEHRYARRVLEGHPSVEPEDYVITVEGVPQVKLGVFAIRPGVDSIALDARGEWLYFSAVTTNHMYRAATRDLDDDSLSASELALRVDTLPTAITESDGIAMGPDDTIYIADPEHSAVVALGPDGRLRTLLKDRHRFRWPDGFAFGPDGWLYFTCSSLQFVILESDETIAAHAPYPIYRFRPPASPSRP